MHTVYKVDCLCTMLNGNQHNDSILFECMLALSYVFDVEPEFCKIYGLTQDYKSFDVFFIYLFLYFML